MKHTFYLGHYYKYSDLKRHFVLKYPVKSKKINTNYHFYWNLRNCLTFMCSLPNDKYKVSYSYTYYGSKRQLDSSFICFSWCSFFTFWVVEKHVLYIAPLRSSSYVLRSFVCLEVSNRVSNWNRTKSLIFVWSILQICQLEIPLFIFKLMCQSSLRISVSYGFCEFKA